MKQRKYYMNGHFEDETTMDYMGQNISAGKFIPENHVVDTIIDVTLPLFRSYGMASEELAQETGWIKYTIPQEQDINQDQQGQQQQQQDRQENDRMDTENHQNDGGQRGRGRGQPRGQHGRGEFGNHGGSNRGNRGRGTGANGQLGFPRHDYSYFGSR